MEDQLVTFPTAKLAKEKGFDYKCGNWATGKENDWKLYFQSSVVHQQNWNRLTNSEYEIMSIPTQSLLQRWLREVHNISVESIRYKSLKYDCAINRVENNHFIVEQGFGQIFNTYEEAIEEGLPLALRLI